MTINYDHYYYYDENGQLTPRPEILKEVELKQKEKWKSVNPLGTTEGSKKPIKIILFLRAISRATLTYFSSLVFALSLMFMNEEKLTELYESLDNTDDEPSDDE